MNQNDNKNNKNDKNSNLRGVISLLCWAALLTIVISYASNYLGSAASHTGSAEIRYTDFLDLLEEGQVREVQVDSTEGTLVITPVEGYVYKDPETGTTYETDYHLYCVPTESGDAITARCEEAGVPLGEPYQAAMNPILAVLISYVVPFVFIFLMFSLAMRWINKKGGMGGIGGIGGVGKANAKVYMEKSTGVTFRDVAGQDEAKES